MRHFITLIAAALLSFHAHSAEPTCSAAASDKKLAVAARPAEPAVRQLQAPAGGSAAPGAMDL